MPTASREEQIMALLLKKMHINSDGLYCSNGGLNFYEIIDHVLYNPFMIEDYSGIYDHQQSISWATEIANGANLSALQKNSNLRYVTEEQLKKLVHLLSETKKPLRELN